MFLPQFRDMEMESYDVEITTASRVTELFDDITATVVACQAMVDQIEGLVNLARMTVESGHRRWGMCLADWIQQDLAELDLMVDSLNDEGLKTERMAISERGRMMMYSHVLSSIADLRGSVECVIQAIEGMAETDIVDEKESGFAEIGPPYVRVCSLLPAYRFAHNSLSEDLSDDVWLSTMKVVTLMVRRMEDAMISVVSRSEWAADKSDPFLRTSTHHGTRIDRAIPNRANGDLRTANRRIQCQVGMAGQLNVEKRARVDSRSRGNHD